MDTDTVIGMTLLVLALGLISGLVLWSRRAINRIAEKRLGSVRDIVRELKNGG